MSRGNNVKRCDTSCKSDIKILLSDKVLIHTHVIMFHPIRLSIKLSWELWILLCIQVHYVKYSLRLFSCPNTNNPPLLSVLPGWIWSRVLTRFPSLKIVRFPPRPSQDTARWCQWLSITLIDDENLYLCDKKQTNRYWQIWKTTSIQSNWT